VAPFRGAARLLFSGLKMSLEPTTTGMPDSPGEVNVPRVYLAPGWKTVRVGLDVIIRTLAIAR
jgi:hypothetical protein